MGNSKEHQTKVVLGRKVLERTKRVVNNFKLLNFFLENTHQNLTLVDNLYKLI